MTQRYRIEELYTAGWELIDESAQNLTKEECSARLKQFVAQGINPNYLRAVPDVSKD
jgi:hypothetical protein